MVAALRLPSREKATGELRIKIPGALRDWEVEDPETGKTHRFRVAYIYSSEEQRGPRRRRARAAQRRDSARRIRNGLAGATTRPANRSTPASPGSSPDRSST